MLLQDFVNLTVSERIEQLEKLAGDELKAFAAEVAAKDGALPILGAILRNTNTPEALIKRTLRSSLIKLGVDLTPPVVEQEQVASQPSDREPADWNKIKAFQEVASVQPSEAEKQELLAKFYGEAAVDLDMANPMNGLEKVQGQVKAICDKMAGYSFNNFGALAQKFSEGEFNIQGQQNRATVFSNAKQIKIMMESILYVVKNATEDNRRSLANTYRDRQFACAEGTLDNLVEIYGEMSLNKQDIAAYIAQQKRQFIREVLSPLYRNNYFAQLAMPYNSGNERHDIPSLTNAVAAEFGLLVKQDKYTKDASAVAQFISDEVNAAFAKPEAQNAFIDGVAGLIANSLERNVDEGSELLTSQVQQFLNNLGFAPRYNFYHLVHAEDRMLRNSKQIFGIMVKVFFDESRIKDEQYVRTYKKELDILGSVNSKFEQRITKRVIGELSDLTDTNLIRTIQTCGLKFDKDEFGEENPFLLLNSNRAILDDENRIESFLKNTTFIRRQHSVAYFIENFSADEFAKLNVTKEQLTEALLSTHKHTKPDTVVKLIRAGADVNALNRNGRSTLRIAERNKRQAIAQALRDNGAESIDIRDIIVKKITDFTNPDVAEDTKKTLLTEIVGIIEKYPFIAKEVIDAEGNSLMYFAVTKKSKEIVEALLKTQAGIASFAMTRDNNDLIPFVVAMKSDLPEILQLFLQTEEGRKTLDSLLFKIIRSQDPNSSKWLETILKTEEGRKALKALRDRTGQTALHIACNTGVVAKVEAIMKTVEGKELVSIQDTIGVVPLHTAAIAGHEAVVKFLLQDQSAAITVTATDNDGRTILHNVHDNCAAVLLARPEVRRLLRSTTDHNGSTPMHMGRSKFVELALQHPEGKKALGIADNNGRSPLYYYIYRTDLKAIEECSKVFAGEFEQKFFLEEDKEGKTAWVRLAEDIDGGYQITQLYSLIATKFPQLLFGFFNMAIDDEGSSFITYAIRRGNLDLLKSMLASSEAKGRMCIENVALAVRLGNVEIVKEVLKSFDHKYLSTYVHKYIAREFLTLDHAKNNFIKFNIEILKALLAIPEVRNLISGNELASYVKYGDFQALDVVLTYPEAQNALFTGTSFRGEQSRKVGTLLHFALEALSDRPDDQEQKECLKVIIKALKRCEDKYKVEAFLKVQNGNGKTVLDLADAETRERLEACEYTLLRKVPALPTGVPSASTNSTAVASTSLQSNTPAAATPAAEVAIEEEVILVKKRKSERLQDPSSKKRDTTKKEFKDTNSKKRSRE